MQEATVQVRQRGTLTLPAEIRAKYGIQPGDTYRLVDLDGILILTPMVPMVPELAREIERLRLDAGLSIEELLVALREQREQYHSEHYSSEYEVSEYTPGESNAIKSNASASTD